MSLLFAFSEHIWTLSITLLPTESNTELLLCVLASRGPADVHMFNILCRDLFADPGQEDSQREGRDVLPFVLSVCGPL